MTQNVPYLKPQTSKETTDFESADSGKIAESIAIIGIGCRFPGSANSPEAFWKLLVSGIDAITEVPESRWNVNKFYDPDITKPGKMRTRWGGFVDKIDFFDAQFFGISPREASRIDPQQRVMLEVAWEALEDGGQMSERLADSKTGVFIGISGSDYQNIQGSDRDSINAYTNLGGVNCITANRISYVFDLKGPSMTVDTACSSSLVAVHLACQSIWHGESVLAIAGGVNAILRPEATIGFSKASMLSPDGRCFSFDARANGYVRAEGAGIVVLKPLSQAQADRDPIYAVIISSAVNQDGQTNGITVPNGQSQEAALQEACQNAGILPQQIQYIEAHGTGTPVGDPIEAIALGNVLGKNRTLGEYCTVGSVKTNIGHLETASGIAGLIKVALALKHRQIPPNLHFQTPNPKIPFEELGLRVPTTLEPWPNSKEARLAGVNSFGFGGTNAHVLLSGLATDVTDIGDSERGSLPVLLPLSAKSPNALVAVARATHKFLTTLSEGADVSLTDICHTASNRRGHHDHRLALVAHTKENLVENLEAFLAGENRPSLSSGHLVPDFQPKLAVVFSGMGPQWWAMGRQLLESEPIFREVIEQCDELLRQYADWSLLSELRASEETSRINSTQIAQCSIFAVQIALAALWRSWGITPQAIVGHSVGEVAAAHVAGALSLSDALQVIFHRSRVQASAAGFGKMLAVGLSQEEAERVLAGLKYESCVSIAAVNSLSAVTLAGDSAALSEIAKSLEQKQIFCRFLQVEVPYHSPFMEPLKAELAQSLQEIKPQTATIPLFSTVTSKQVEGSELDGTYWGLNMREPVLFAAAISSLIQADYNTFLEISAHPVLANSISECLALAKISGTVLQTLRRFEPERATMLSSFGKLYTLGYPIDWHHLYPQQGRFVRLPSYPWQRERCWQESEESMAVRIGTIPQRSMLGQQVHPLLGSRLKSSQPMWDAEMTAVPTDWLVFAQPNPDACLRLFCFPYLGGSSSEFLPWSDCLPSSVEVCAIKLPGGKDFLGEQSFDELTSIVKTLVQVLLPYLDKPFAFYGHSLGALVSFELTRQLRRENSKTPAHLFVGASQAPQIPYLHPSVEKLPEFESVKGVSINDLPQLYRDNTELVGLLPLILKEVTLLAERYSYTEEEPLNCPISVFGGIQDKVITEDLLSAWREQTRSNFKLQMLSGNHLFLHSDQQLLLQAISEELSSLLCLSIN